jgi:hypothetical protein
MWREWNLKKKGIMDVTNIPRTNDEAGYKILLNLKSVGRERQ